jgi:hypothetical protein
VEIFLKPKGLDLYRLKALAEGNQLFCCLFFVFILLPLISFKPLWLFHSNFSTSLRCGFLYLRLILKEGLGAKCVGEGD